MARVTTNCAFSSVHGRVGDVIVKTYKYGEVMSRVPRMGPYVPSEKQSAGNNRWREAAAYYQRVKADPLLMACYARIVTKKGCPLNAIVTRDYMLPPKIKALDVSQYHGKAGERISVDATDDCQVKAVEFTLRDADGSVIEFGFADCPLAITWHYQTQCAAPLDRPIMIEAVAIDLPGNRASLLRPWPASSMPTPTTVVPPSSFTPNVAPAPPANRSDPIW